MSLTDASPTTIARTARAAALQLALLSPAHRDAALQSIHDGLVLARSEILAANARDVMLATQAAAEGTLSQAVLKRLDLSRPGKYEDMLRGVLDVKALPDPIGRVDLATELAAGLVMRRVSCPIGVLLIIFEARPEVIANIASLAIKSGNAAILKGGSETTQSFQTIAEVVSRALDSTSVPNAAVQLVTSREAIKPLLALDEYVDLVIPRGGNALVKYCKSNTAIPVLGHADGLCSIYLHHDADAAMAAHVVVDAKTGYTAACNSVETLLVHAAALTTVLPAVAQALLLLGVSLRCDAPSKHALTSVLDPHQARLIQDAVDEDYDTEFLDLILAIKTVPACSTPSESVDLAIAHINGHGSHHTDAIITADASAGEQFMAGVDSACVLWNATTRMSDGQRCGFGTEVGVSTNKIHARGPVGLEGLTIYKYKFWGQGQAAGDMGTEEGKVPWTHRSLPI